MIIFLISLSYQSTSEIVDLIPGQEYIEKYFDELLRANTSMDARLNIINWKLNKRRFWDNVKPEKIVELCEPAEAGGDREGGGAGEGDGDGDGGDGNEEDEGEKKAHPRMDSHQVSFVEK